MKFLIIVVIVFFTSLYTCSLYNFTHSHDFSFCQMYIFIPDLSSEPQTHLSPFLLDIFMWMFHRNLKFKILKNNSTFYTLNLPLFFIYSIK